MKKKTSLIIIILLLSLASTIVTNPVEEVQSEEQGTPKYGGTLRVTYCNPLYVPWSLNPLVDWEVIITPNGEAMFNSLLRWNGTKVISDLAQSWEISEDGLNYTFHLYQNITWHDGLPFNASDIEYSFDTALFNPDAANYWKDASLAGCNITSIEILDTFTVIFRLGKIFPEFLDSVWVPIIPCHLYEGTDLRTNLYNTHPVGTGPFTFVEWAPGINLTLQANEMYFRGRPYLDRIFIKWDIPREELTNSLMNNTLDVVPGLVDPYRMTDLEKIHGITTISSVQSGFFYAGFNLDHSILNDIAVRKALSHAVNKTHIIEDVYLGYAEPASSPISPAWSSWCNPNVTKYDYNPSLAESLLDQAGYLRDSETGVRFNLTIKALYTSFASARIVADGWTEIGVNTTVVSINDVNEFSNEINNKREFDVAMGGFAGPGPYFGALYLLWHSGEWLNAWNYSSDRVDHLLEEALITIDENTRRDMLNELQEILSNDIPVIFTIHQIRLTGYNNDFHGFSFGSDQGLEVSAYSLEKVWYDPTLSGQGKSPLHVRFIDSLNRTAGYLNETFPIVAQIPDSTYEPTTETVKIRSPDGKYTIELFGTGNGSYSLEIVNVALDYKYVNVPAGYIHENETKQYYVYVYPDGTMDFFDPQIDLVKDNVIDIFDLVTVAMAYGSTSNDPSWNVIADIVRDDVIDIFDLVAIALNYGKEWTH